MKDFSKLAKPLDDLLKKVENKTRNNKNTSIEMNQDAVAPFKTMTGMLMSPPIRGFEITVCHLKFIPMYHYKE